jgi:hypothetical protein
VWSKQNSSFVEWLLRRVSVWCYCYASTTLKLTVVIIPQSYCSASTTLKLSVVIILAKHNSSFGEWLLRWVSVWSKQNSSFVEWLLRRVSVWSKHNSSFVEWLPHWNSLRFSILFLFMLGLRWNHSHFRRHFHHYLILQCHNRRGTLDSRIEQFPGHDHLLRQQRHTRLVFLVKVYCYKYNKIQYPSENRN